MMLLMKYRSTNYNFFSQITGYENKAHKRVVIMIAIGFTYSPSISNANGLVHGLFEGEVLNSDSNLSGYTFTDDLYSEIDALRTAAAMSDAGLDIYMTILPEPHRQRMPNRGLMA